MEQSSRFFLNWDDMGKESQKEKGALKHHDQHSFVGKLYKMKLCHVTVCHATIKCPILSLPDVVLLYKHQNPSNFF